MSDVLKYLNVSQQTPVDPLKYRKTLNLSNNDLKKLIKELKKDGVACKSYNWVQEQFKAVKEELGTYEKVNIPLSINKEDPDAEKKTEAKKVVIEDRPLVYHSNLHKYVCQTIKMLDDKNLLLLHKDGVEDGILEILWSGDKAQDTFLFSFQILNVANAQSRDNTRPALMFQGPDTYENLDKAFDVSSLGNFL